MQQAADITDDLLDASKYKSLAVYAEVKLAEALDKAAQACPNSIAGAAPEDCEDGQPLPNPLATAVCCEVGPAGAMAGQQAPTHDPPCSLVAVSMLSSSQTLSDGIN